VYIPQYELPPESAESGPTPRRQAVDDFETFDEVWLTMRREAREAADKESLLVSYIHSTILHQRSL
jgi:Serine acetyltransferase, N-terminal